MTSAETSAIAPTDSGCAIEVRGLTKAFGNKLALNGIDLRVDRGTCMVIFGANGAGKTTLIKVLATISKPSSGSIRIDGLDIRHKSVEIRHRIGMVVHQTFLYDNLTAYENLKFYGKMYGVSDLDMCIRDTITRVGLSTHLHDRVADLSRGMQQRLSIARALLHNPPILLLDEPETGLDQHAMALFREVLDAFKVQLKTVVMTTHNLHYGLEIADRVAVLAKGKIVYQALRKSLDASSFLRTYQNYGGAKN